MNRPPRPRWSNTRIGRLPLQVKHTRVPASPYYTAQSVIDAARLVRDDYEAEYQRLCQRIAELEAIIDRDNSEWRILAARITELEATVLSYRNMAVNLLMDDDEGSSDDDAA